MFSLPYIHPLSSLSSHSSHSSSFLSFNLCHLTIFSHLTLPHFYLFLHGFSKIAADSWSPNTTVATCSSPSTDAIASKSDHSELKGERKTVHKLPRVIRFMNIYSFAAVT